MRTRWLALCAITLLLAACGGGGSGGGDAGGAAGGGVGNGGQPPPPPPPATGDVVSITVSVPTAPVPSGGSTQFKVIVANPGNAVATNISAALNLGSGLTKGTVGCIPHNGAACPANPDALVIPSLPAGGSLELLVTALVVSGASGPIVSTASVTADGDKDTTDNTAQAVINVYSADVRVTGNGDGGVFFSGAIATYSMTLSNLGPDTARSVTVQDVVGPGQALSSITCTATGAVCPATQTSSLMSIPSLPNGGSLTFTVSASIAATAFGPISNTLHVSVDGDPVSSNNVATSSASARMPVSPQSPSFVALRSDVGDFIGQGESYDYDRSNAVIDLSANGPTLSLVITGDEHWRADFGLPNSLPQLTPGTYTNLQQYAFDDPAVGGLEWSGESRGCGPLTGTITIDAVNYAAGVLQSLDLRFEQHCSGKTPALRGQIHWNANDGTQPPGPVNPPPAGLWSPAKGATPKSGNYAYLQSDGGDFLGQGGTYTYTNTNAVLTLTVTGNQLQARVDGDEYWDGVFQTMNSITALQPGYYGYLERYPFNNPAKGGMDVNFESRGCNELSGWFVIDSITFSGGALASLDLRFEQQCLDGGPIGALRGKVHWASNDTTQPPGPQNPPPPNLWVPAPGATPASGNYVYLKSDPGEFVGGGGTYTYTQADAFLDVSTTGARLDVGIRGEQSWTGNFQGMNTLAQLTPGYYGDLQRYPFHNPAKGGLDVSGQGNGCNVLAGWFVVDSVSYSGGSLAAIDLRFEQTCHDPGALLVPLHGKIHWAAGDPTKPPTVQIPPPPNLWSPAPGATPASGNYVYLASDPGDIVGQGRTYTYTNANAVFNLNNSNPLFLQIFVNGDEQWNGNFVAMETLAQLVPGYYGNVEHYPFNNPVRAGMSWGAACYDLSGWFVIDGLTVAGGSVQSVDLRFEQHCDGGPPMHGKIHWAAGDTTQAPGPQNPPPSNLWKPAAGATPASGNYLYVMSDPGDYVGMGETYTETLDTSTFALSEPSPGHLTMNVIGPSNYLSGDFQAMNSLNELQPGYYGDLQRWPFQNQAKGGMDVDSDGRGCNQLSGWFAVDSITRVAGNLASIDLRFEQRCDGGPALHAQLHWIQ